MDIDGYSKVKHIKPDNLYDMLFNDAGQSKENSSRKLVI
jgi:hypothetical protein